MTHTTSASTGLAARQVNAVLALHSKRSFDGDGYGWGLCAECRQSWPCATVKAIEAAS